MSGFYIPRYGISAHENVLVLEMLRREHKVPACNAKTQYFGRFVSGLAGWDLGSIFRPGCCVTPESAVLLFFQDFVVCSMDSFAKSLGWLGSVWQRMKNIKTQTKTLSANTASRQDL